MSSRESRRGEFSLPSDVHYMNCAYMSPLPKVVEEVGMEALRSKRFPAGIGPDDFFMHSRVLRERFAPLIGAADPDRVAIHPSASYGVATAARNIPVEAGQNIVLLHEQFPGNVYSWRRKADETGAEIRTVMPPESHPRGQGWSERILEAIDPGTAVVSVPTVHWTDGTRVALAAIGERAREVGAAFVIDGTQSVGAVEIDVCEIRPDVLIAAGYKWLLGPYSIALAWFGERFDDGVPLEETWIARKGSEDFQGLVDYQDEYQPGAIRYDVGERSNFILVPMLSRALELLLEWTPAGISEYCAELTRPLIDRAVEVGFTVEDEAWRSPHIFGLYMPEGIDLRTLRDELQERKIHVSLRGQALRVSPHVYNGPEEVAALIEALESARG